MEVSTEHALYHFIILRYQEFPGFLLELTWQFLSPNANVQVILGIHQEECHWTLPNKGSRRWRGGAWGSSLAHLLSLKHLLRAGKGWKSCVGQLQLLLPSSFDEIYDSLPLTCFQGATALHCFLEDTCQNAKKNDVTAAGFIQVRVLFIRTSGLHHCKHGQEWIDISKAFQRKPRNTEGAIWVLTTIGLQNRNNWNVWLPEITKCQATIKIHSL